MHSEDKPANPTLEARARQLVADVLRKAAGPRGRGPIPRYDAAAQHRLYPGDTCFDRPDTPIVQGPWKDAP